ncbi:MAG: hypothetical protein ACTSQE_12610 [Candidatus Heimdallarchaeaceae archaeon]
MTDFIKEGSNSCYKCGSTNSLERTGGNEFRSYSWLCGDCNKKSLKKSFSKIKVPKKIKVIEKGLDKWKKCKVHGEHYKDKFVGSKSSDQEMIGCMRCYLEEKSLKLKDASSTARCPDCNILGSKNYIENKHNCFNGI